MVIPPNHHAFDPTYPAALHPGYFRPMRADAAYSGRGYETGSLSSNVAPGVVGLLMSAMKQLLQQ